MIYTRFIASTRQPSAVLQSMLLVLCLALTAIFSHPALSQESATDKNIVVLFHSADFSLFKQQFTAGLNEYIDNTQNNYPNSRVIYEFLELQNVPQGYRPTELIDLLKYNQRIDPASVVVSVLATTSEFLFNYGDEIYGDTPVVHAFASPPVINGITSTGNQNTRFIPSVFRTTFDNTLTSIFALLPGTDHLYLVSGVSETDLAYADSSRPSLQNLPPTIETTFLSGLTTNELTAQLSILSEGSVVIMLLHEMDRNRKLIRLIDVFNTIKDSTSVPVFSNVSSLFPQGIVGGNYSDVRSAGGLAAEMAFSMLANEPADSQPLGRTTVYSFDHAQLQRWGIDENLLPAGSVLENRQLTFLELYDRQLLILLAVTSGLLLLALFFRYQSKIVGTQKTLFESVINSITDAIFIADTNGIVIAVNDGAAQLSGLSKDELLGKLTSGLRDNYVIERTEATGTDDFGGLTEPTVLKFKKKNGEILSGEAVSTAIINSQGEVLGNISLIRDISKRLSLEEEQRQGQKMEALGNLVGGISHDFNNILGVISGYAELSMVNKESSSLEGNQTQILKATDRAKSLVSQIMTFSRDSNIAQSSTDLAVLLDETMKLIKVSIPSSIDIVLKKGEGVRPIMGSAVQLQQIIINLTTNAYQAMASTGGSITISLNRKQVSEEINLSHGVLKPGHYSVMSISDTGPGMSQAIASRIFEPYFTTKAQGEGSGMGMAIVYNLAKAHGAMLNLETVVGEGTCITLYFLEAADIDAGRDADTNVAVARGNGERILLVDDEEGLLDTTEKLLSGIGYQLTAFSNANDALEAFKRAPEDFDLLVSDQSMPKMTGLQLLREIRNLSPGFPAIICTGYSDVIDQKDVSHLALAGVLRKPYKLAEIAEIIKEALPYSTNARSIT